MAFIFTNLILNTSYITYFSYLNIFFKNLHLIIFYFTRWQWTKWKTNVSSWPFTIKFRNDFLINKEIGYVWQKHILTLWLKDIVHFFLYYLICLSLQTKMIILVVILTIHQLLYPLHFKSLSYLLTVWTESFMQSIKIEYSHSIFHAMGISHTI